jgi:hypothetical protein
VKIWSGVFLIASGCVAAGCVEDGGDRTASPDESMAAKLSRSLQFPNSMLLNESFPATTDPRAVLLPLGPTAVIAPEQSAILAFELEDPDRRAASATLIQFEDAPSYQRVPVEEGDGSSIVIENEATASTDLCAGLCDAIFTVTVKEAVELEGGAVSAVSTREIVVDCRQHGDRADCDQPLGGVELLSSLPCGDVTAGESALAADRTLDAQLEAVRVVSFARTHLEQRLAAITADLATALGLAPGSDTAMVAAALQARIDAVTSAGLSLLLGERGCGMRRAHVLHALLGCDPLAAVQLPELSCQGLCQPTIAASGCAVAETSGCRGLIESASCAGTCTGACQAPLAEPSVCAGTCIGSCDGACPGDGVTCAGPCDGLCSGECRALSAGPCEAGQCTGLCDEPVAGVPACMAPLDAHCSAAPDLPLACAGDCFGSAELAAGSALCQPSALATGDALPRCEAALAQLSFAFQPGLSAQAESDFASLVDGLNVPVAQLTEITARIDRLLVAAARLQAAGEGAVGDYLQSALASRPGDAPLQCAAQRLPQANTWLASLPASLEALRGQTLALLSVVTAAP